jgi:hypothetical protein
LLYCHSFFASRSEIAGWSTAFSPKLAPTNYHPRRKGFNVENVPGTCPMHASSVDLSKTLVALGKIPGPPTMPIFVPTPNHDHVVDNSHVNTVAIWWEVRPVLVLDQSDWPAPDGSSGITSASKMDDVEAAGRAIEVGSNFFLFFVSRPNSAGGMAAMTH